MPIAHPRVVSPRTLETGGGLKILTCDRALGFAAFAKGPIYFFSIRLWRCLSDDRPTTSSVVSVLRPYVARELA
jgi:hypothetical protein